jgi:hypothetical protein
LIGKPEWKRLLGRHMHRLEDNIRMDLRRKGVIRCGLTASGSG